MLKQIQGLSKNVQGGTGAKPFATVLFFIVFLSIIMCAMSDMEYPGKAKAVQASLHMQ
jgi:hypothetical protein